MLPVKTYKNPVSSISTPDPFVLKHLGAYWCYCTGRTHQGMCFPLLTSRDLVHWTQQEGAMHPLSEHYVEYWAPEVFYWDGTFCLYYSVGDGSVMHVRVALANSPSGPFHDSGSRLTQQDFAIDPHVFEDEDGTRWLFYATDFLEHSHTGTGTVVDRLMDPFTLEGRTRPVVRAQYDWQLFDPQRKEKGGVRWHTVEGPAVLKRKGVYYEMFSGGNWQNASYGVGYAYSPTIESENEWTQVCDGVNVLPVLRTSPGVTGPGHNSVVRGPDNRQLFCVYHRWDESNTGRLMAIDRLEWVGPDLSVFGPTDTPQAFPNTARLLSLTGTSPQQGQWFVLSGEWSLAGGRIRQSSTQGYCDAQFKDDLTAGFLLECGVRALDSTAKGRFGLNVRNNNGAKFDVSVRAQGSLQFHLLRIEGTGRFITASLNGKPAGQTIFSGGAPSSIHLFTEGSPAEFEALSLTRGWQDTFEGNTSLEELGWDAQGGWAIESAELRHSEGRAPGTIFKHVPATSYEFVVNARRPASADRFYGFFPAATVSSRGPLVAVVRRGERWILCVDSEGRGEIDKAIELSELPRSFHSSQYEQLSFAVSGDFITIRWRGNLIHEMKIGQHHTERVGLFAAGNIAFDMVRVTEQILD